MSVLPTAYRSLERCGPSVLLPLLDLADALQDAQPSLEGAQANSRQTNGAVQCRWGSATAMVDYDTFRQGPQAAFGSKVAHLACGCVRRLCLGLHVLGDVEVSGDDFIVSQLIRIGRVERGLH